MEAEGPVVYVLDIDHPVLSAEATHHLQRVLRLRPGEPFAVCDGVGSWRQLYYGATVAAMGEPQREVQPPWPVAVLTALPKGERADWMLQKVTEVGVDEIVLVDCERSVVRWNGERRDRQLERARRIVAAAAAQARRAWLPTLRGPLRFSEVAPSEGTARGDVNGGPITPATRSVMIGPEGGWSATEAAAALPSVGLGPQVLRTETAAVVASTLLVAIRSRLVLAVSAAPGNTLGG